MYSNIRNEMKYLNLIRNVLKFGEKRTGRNGDIISYFGQQMRFDLTDDNKPELEYGTLVIKKIPENSVIKVADSSGAIFELKLNDEQMIAAGICNWEVKSNGVSLGKGSYDIYPSETNPLFVNI